MDEHPAFVYAKRFGWPVFPIRDRKPATPHGHLDATTDPAKLALMFAPGWEGYTHDVAVRTGIESGLVIVDIDRKNGKDGLDSLEAAFGVTTNPQTPTAYTPSGGIHWFFAHPGAAYFVKSTTSIPEGVDIKGDRSSCSLPPASGRSWDPHLNLLSVLLAPLPLWVPREPRRQERAKARDARTAGIHPYGRAALQNACKAIAGADNGSQQATLNTEAFCIGQLVGGREIDESTAKRMLLWAAEQMRNYATPWRRSELEEIVDRALAEGKQQP